ncbi:DEAD-box ATP-dependent RNA helicase 20-like [Oopsacas minuta]|uniref:RNA helicase n=1 Tax=Oopsacas minuta TaxID=111878 RepID=A0AAV7JSQ8_9METZ|nr:DEAD-box ATP-dependent RNA helicase 20-like [Oopsacas minuta]
MSDWDSEGWTDDCIPTTTIVNSSRQVDQFPRSSGRGAYQIKTTSNSFQQNDGVRAEPKFVPSRGGFGHHLHVEKSPSREPYQQLPGLGDQPPAQGSELRGLSRGRISAFQETDTVQLGFSFLKHETTSKTEEKKQMQIPTNMVGRIIGKKGAKIQELERESGCSIKAPKPSEQVEGQFQSLSLIGSQDQIVTAIKLIEDELIYNSNHRPNASGFSSFSERGERGGRGFRGPDNFEVRKPRAFRDRDEHKANSAFGERDSRTGFSSNRGFGDREESKTRVGFGDREESKTRVGFGDREESKTRIGFGDREESKTRVGFGDREESKTRVGFGDREESKTRIGFGDREESKTRVGFGDRSREDSRTNSGFGDRNRGYSRSEYSSNRGFGDREDSRTNSGFSNSRGFGDREESRRTGFSNSNSRSFGSQQQNNDSPPPTTPTPKIDWSKINSEREAYLVSKFEGLRAVKKDFYKEDPVVNAFTKSQVEHIRRENNGLIADDLSNLNREVPNPVLTFEQAFREYPEILEQIYKQKFVEPTPIQKQSWPIALLGYDMVGIAQTGTGKTLAFLLPGLIHMAGQTLFEGERGPGILVVCPTRELALQTDAEVKKFKFRGFDSVCVYGGGNRSLQVQQLNKGAKIVIGTPGRLHDLQMSGDLILKAVSYFVLDEADRMLDMGFEPQILKLVIDIRPDRQTLMTSATWPADVRRLADSYLKNPFQVYVGSLDLKACHSVSQTIEIMDGHLKKDRAYEFLSKMKPEDKVLIFTSKKATADDVASDFFIRGIDAQSIHGDRVQEDREQALDDFKSGRVKILVATDVASRGLDIPNVTYVVNFDFPVHIEDYVHRIGRTGRAGKTGKSLTFFTRENWQWARPLIEILEEAQQDVPEELFVMAERFKARQERDKREGRFGGGGGRGGRGGGGRFSKKDNDKFSCFV